MDLLYALQSRGLSSQESEVYLSLLQTGSSPSSKLARILKRNRVTIYSTLKNLISKGVVSEFKKGNTFFYQAINPEQMGDKISQKQQKFLESIPFLNAMMQVQNNRPKVEYFEGIAGLKTIYEDICSYPNKEIYMFMGVEYMDPSFKKWIDTIFVPLRKQRKIFAKVIAPETDDMVAYQKSDKNDQRAIKLFPPEKLSFTNEITIYGDRIACGLFGKDEMAGVIIQSASLAKTLREIFQLLREV